MTPESNDALHKRKAKILAWTEPMSLNAGRELDALVATRVFGLVMCTCANHNEHFPRALCYALLDSPDKGGELRCYSTDIAAAWLVVEKLRERFDTVIVESCLEGFAVRIGDYEAPAPLVHVSIDPRQGGVALCICLASLKAVSAPRPPSA